MQRTILKNKNRISWISVILIVLAYMSKWTRGDPDLFIWPLIIELEIWSNDYFLQLSDMVKFE